LWILDHRRDVEADMRATFQLSPAQAAALPAAEFFALAYRLPYYPGVLQARAAAQLPGSGMNGDRREVREVPATRRAILADPDLSAAVSFGSADG
jgi:hypothetical protein